MTSRKAWAERLYDYYSAKHDEEGKDKPGDKCYDRLVACGCQPKLAAPPPVAPPVVEPVDEAKPPDAPKPPATEKPPTPKLDLPDTDTDDLEAKLKDAIDKWINKRKAKK